MPNLGMSTPISPLDLNITRTYIPPRIQRAWPGLTLAMSRLYCRSPCSGLPQVRLFPSPVLLFRPVAAPPVPPPVIGPFLDLECSNFSHLVLMFFRAMRAAALPRAVPVIRAAGRRGFPTPSVGFSILPRVCQATRCCRPCSIASRICCAASRNRCCRRRVRSIRPSASASMSHRYGQQRISGGRCARRGRRSRRAASRRGMPPASRGACAAGGAPPDFLRRRRQRFKNPAW
jgi:hypothetical protein